MLRNLEHVLIDLDGNPIKFTDNDGEITAKHVITNSLLNARIEGEQPNGEKSYKRYCLCLEVHKGGNMDFKSDELELIKRLTAIMYAPLVVGQIYKWCDTDFVPVSATPKVKLKS